MKMLYGFDRFVDEVKVGPFAPLFGSVLEFSLLEAVSASITNVQLLAWLPWTASMSCLRTCKRRPSLMTAGPSAVFGFATTPGGTEIAMVVSGVFLSVEAVFW